MRRFFVAGQPVDLWECEQFPFGWTQEDMEGYAVACQWELLFNALVLAAQVEAESPVA